MHHISGSMIEYKLKFLVEHGHKFVSLCCILFFIFGNRKIKDKSVDMAIDQISFLRSECYTMHLKDEEAERIWWSLFMERCVRNQERELLSRMIV
ncbi:uncharacterized protein BT62DRAFT_557563 [Guyanagaster necrorhizus]|uniref:Uncharacterized protein n=1 Tax=Guyanagaster necrorhizus TaxID=856835 RepID=A0A9P7VI11_9AGAR|nr:uncharacterized protein BT62DRAFT_557563 [Guyanagaster necrorhizus MCA 3950]KAG7440920.1 hypothetical protein BT62DRAFT_557563 [Guyanagaster necrorhizus MCA 3950]